MNDKGYAFGSSADSTVSVPNQHGEMMKVKLDARVDVRGSESPHWCGKHAPAKPELCVNHSGRLHELHDEEILDMFGVEAIFYCPKFGCDNFAWDVRASYLISVGTKGRLHLTLDPYSNMRTVVFELFRNAALLKILFLKQRQMAEKLGLL